MTVRNCGARPRSLCPGNRSPTVSGQLFKVPVQRSKKHFRRMAVQIASAEPVRSLAEKFFRQAPRQLVTGPSCQLVVTLEKGADNVTTLWEAGGELIRREGELRRGEPLHLQGDVCGSLHGALADDD